MQKVLALIKKDFQLDSRLKYPVASTVLYLVATAYISYLAFNNIINKSVWNALFWIVLLFASVTGLAKSFIQENGRSLYYFFVAKPHTILIGKLVYYTLYQLMLSVLTVLLLSLFLGNMVNSNSLFYANLLVASLGLASVFTMISALSAKTSSQSTMMAVLGFPLVIPMMLLAVSNSRKILMGAQWVDVSGNLLTLISLVVVIIALIFILFPYSWRN